MKPFLPLLAFLFTINLTFSQTTSLIEEDFSDGIPANWTHCSGNWGTSPQWLSRDSILTIESGPYFARVLDGIQLPAVDLSSIDNPALELDLAMIELDTNIQFTIYYSTDSVCLTEWDEDAGFHDFLDREILASYSPEGNNSGYQHILINLADLGSESKVFFTLTADCMNYFAYGDWTVDNLNISGDLTLNTQDHAADIALHLSPNPANSMLTISGASDDFNYSIINTTGSSVMTGIGHQIDVSTLPKGFYYLVSANQRLKFIKQ